jgi:hypothetical protein
MRKTQKDSFWVTNKSNVGVSLADLSLTIMPMTSINLLDSKHYYYTKEQLIKSAESGSIYKKRDKVVVRKVAPEIDKPHFITTAQSMIKTKKRSVLETTYEHYEELIVKDEELAAEAADSVEEDRQPILSNK